MPSISSAYHFGPFSLHPASRLLLEDGQPVRLGARAMDLLTALVERRGEVISKEELFRLVWPNTIVEETSLRVHVAALRKALGAVHGRSIVNVPGKGYSFAGELHHPGAVVWPVARSAAPASVPLLDSHRNLPVRLTRMIGRTGAAQGVATALLTRRFVTITGEGGVGKTTLALSVAEESAEDYADGIAFADLAALSPSEPLVSTVGRAVGLVLPTNSPVSALTEALSGRRFLLILDNCEHLVADAAALAVELLRTVPSLRVLATSREALRADGEYVHRLDALPSPPPNSMLTAAQALDYAAIQLLVERICATMHDYVLDDHDAPLAAELCRRLDGIPLAIELAAARVGFFGLEGLLTRLHDRLHILTSGHRTSMPRHQTLRALYDWSFELLTPQVRDAFCRLAVFPGAFTLEAGLALMPFNDRPRALSTLLDLISKSLVASDLGEETRRYHLLDTTRVYAMEKLVLSGALEDCRLAHARYLVRTLEAANLEWERGARGAWLVRFGPLMADVTMALGWLASESSSTMLYAQLVGASFQLTQQLSQLDYHQPHLWRALSRLRDDTPLKEAPQAPSEEVPAGSADRDRADLQLRITIQLGQSIAHGRPSHQSVQAWMKGAAPLLEAEDIQPSLLFSVAVAHLAHGDYRASLKAAERLELLADANRDRQTGVIARRVQAQNRYFLGDLALARRLAEEVLRFPIATLRHGEHLDAVDRKLSMGILLATTTWLEGDADEADRLIQMALALAPREVEQAQCMALAMAAIPLALWNGDLPLAGRRLEALRQLTGRARLADYWVEWSEAFSHIIHNTPLQGPVGSAKLGDMLSTLSPTYADPRMLARAESGASGWSAPEVLRLHGERLRLAPHADPAEVRRLFQRALQMARQHGSLRWELRAALSLVRFDLAQGSPLPSDQLLLSPLARLNGLRQPPEAHEARLCLRDLERLRNTLPD